MENLSGAAKQLGSRGGKKSVEVRLGGKTEKERSEFMRRVRLSGEERKKFEKGLQEMVDKMNEEVE